MTVLKFSIGKIGLLFSIKGRVWVSLPSNHGLWAPEQPPSMGPGGAHAGRERGCVESVKASQSAGLAWSPPSPGACRVPLMLKSRDNVWSCSCVWLWGEGCGSGLGTWHRRW